MAGVQLGAKFTRPALVIRYLMVGADQQRRSRSERAGAIEAVTETCSNLKTEAKVTLIRTFLPNATPLGLIRVRADGYGPNAKSNGRGPISEIVDKTISDGISMTVTVEA